mmetsp:Transcript_16943/g.45605  ORF Transcript_16943/g.45605 Transcript_16943/m.45605 type:complete len:254 (+) Transcript_16943:1314-2075(+)
MAVDSDGDALEVGHGVDGGSGEGADLLGRGAAVGVAQHDGARPTLGRSADGVARVLCVCLPAIKEVLSIVDHVPPLAMQHVHGLANHVEVLLEGDTEHLGDVEVPGLAHDRARGRLGAQERKHARVVLGANPSPAGHAKGAHAGVAQVEGLDALEEGDVLLVGERVAALDEVEAHFVEALCDLELVVEREAHPFPLSAVAQRRVIHLHVAPLARAPRGAESPRESPREAWDTPPRRVLEERAHSQRHYHPVVR